jgi:MFS family permease
MSSGTASVKTGNRPKDPTGTVIETNIPKRLDRLPWSKWHWLIIVGLGTVWVLDGLEVTIVGSIASRLTEPSGGIHLTTGDIGAAAGIYVAGACVGSLVFGYLTDRFGRKKMFIFTLGLYLLATIATAFSLNPLMFFVFRFFTGAGIGGEYAAINSAIDELIPARRRGLVDLSINGSYWLGTAFGALLSVFFLNTAIFDPAIGWRLAFGLGALFGLTILLVRRNVPESPRWALIHGHEKEAEEIVAGVEKEVEEDTGRKLDAVTDDPMRVTQRRSTGFGEIVRVAVTRYPKRFVLGLSLFTGQAFLYNAVYFTYVLVLTKLMHVPSDLAPWSILPLAIGNLLGPLLLGRLFDSIGRRVMISISYIGSGVLLAITAAMFNAHLFNGTTLTIAWVVVFFFASAGASSAYLTVSEIFPVETRAMSIAFFYAIGTGLGGIVGPVLFGQFIGQGIGAVAFGYYLGAGLMIAAGIVEVFLGVDAARKSLEDIATPISVDANTSENKTV